MWQMGDEIHGFQFSSLLYMRSSIIFLLFLFLFFYYFFFDCTRCHATYRILQLCLSPITRLRKYETKKNLYYFITLCLYSVDISIFIYCEKDRWMYINIDRVEYPRHFVATMQFIFIWRRDCFIHLDYFFIIFVCVCVLYYNNMTAVS